MDQKTCGWGNLKVFFENLLLAGEMFKIASLDVLLAGEMLKIASLDVLLAGEMLKSVSLDVLLAGAMLKMKNGMCFWLGKVKEKMKCASGWEMLKTFSKMCF